MLKHALLIAFVFCFTSCNSVSYIAELQNQKTGLDFRQGTWLLYEVDCPKEIYTKLYGTITEDFSKYLKERLYLSNQLNTVLVPKKVTFNPTKN